MLVSRGMSCGSRSSEVPSEERGMRCTRVRIVGQCKACVVTCLREPCVIRKSRGKGQLSLKLSVVI